MFLLNVLVSCIILAFASEGKTVQGFIGRNVSLSWTYNNTLKNSISISRNSSDLVLVWPLTNFVVWNERDARLQVYIYNATFERVSVTFTISNVTENDAGIYKLKRSLDSEDFNDSITLQIDQSVNAPINGNNSLQQDNDKYHDPLGPLLGVALVIVAVCLIIVAILIVVTQRRKHAFSRSASVTEHQPGAESSNREVHRELLRFENHDRSLTFPIVQNNACRRIRRSGYPVVNRISGSLQTLMNHTQDFWNPLRQAFSLQTLQTLTQLSYAIRSLVQSDDSIRATCCSKKERMSGMEGSANEISIDELSSRAQRDSGVSHDEQNTRSLSLNNFRPQSFEEQSEEEQYITIDEDRLSVYHCVNANEDDETLQKGCRSPEVGNNDYDYAILSALKKPLSFP